jgi:hypothetical protein
MKKKIWFFTMVSTFNVELREASSLEVKNKELQSLEQLSENLKYSFLMRLQVH